MFFYTLGNKMGIDTIAKYAEMAGLGSKTGIDLPHESDGLVPSSKWKMRTYRQKWYAGETISVSIGQGALEVSPHPTRPRDRRHSHRRRLAGSPPGAEEAGKPEAHKENINADNVMQVINGMYAVVNEGGTGGGAKLPNIACAGRPEPHSSPQMMC